LTASQRAEVQFIEELAAEAERSAGATSTTQPREL
jgi:hypothetical protein